MGVVAMPQFVIPLNQNLLSFTNLIFLKNIGPSTVYCSLARFDLHQFEGVLSDAVPIDYKKKKL